MVSNTSLVVQGFLPSTVCWVHVGFLNPCDPRNNKSMGVDRSPHIKSMIDRFLDQRLKAALADGSQLHIFPVTMSVHSFIRMIVF